MLSKVIFSSAATTRGGRVGQTVSEDGRLDLQLDRPKEMGGAGNGTNPEQLFACGYSACFGGVLEFLAQKKKLPLVQSEVTARVAFGTAVEGGYGIGVELNVRLSGVVRAEAETLVAEAHENCPYSKATRGNIDVKIRLLD